MKRRFLLWCFRGPKRWAKAVSRTVPRITLSFLLAVAILPIATAQSSDPLWVDWLFKLPGAEADSESPPVLIRNVRVLTGTGDLIDGTDVLLNNGTIAGVGSNLRSPSGTRIIEGQGHWVTPGLIDVGFDVLTATGSPQPSHIEDALQLTFAEDYLEADTSVLKTALAGGVTSFYAGALRGQPRGVFSVATVLRALPAVSFAQMRLPEGISVLAWHCAPDGLRHLRKVLLPGSDERGDVLTRAAFNGVRNGKMRMVLHCDDSENLGEAVQMLVQARLPISAIVSREAHLLREEIQNRSICAAVPWGAAPSSQAGGSVRVSHLAPASLDVVGRRSGCAIVASGEAGDIGNLHRLVAFARGVGLNNDFRIPEARAITWVTSNPARALGIYDQVGSIERGKQADVVVWSGNPFSAYARADYVFVAGKLVAFSNIQQTEQESQPDTETEDE